eukprot:ctg_933.g326
MAAASPGAHRLLAALHMRYAWPALPRPRCSPRRRVPWRRSGGHSRLSMPPNKTMTQSESCCCFGDCRSPPNKSVRARFWRALSTPELPVARHGRCGEGGAALGRCLQSSEGDCTRRAVHTPSPVWLLVLALACATRRTTRRRPDRARTESFREVRAKQSTRRHRPAKSLTARGGKEQSVWAEFGARTKAPDGSGREIKERCANVAKANTGRRISRKRGSKAQRAYHIEGCTCAGRLGAYSVGRSPGSQFVRGETLGRLLRKGAPECPIAVLFTRPSPTPSLLRQGVLDASRRTAPSSGPLVSSATTCTPRENTFHHVPRVARLARFRHVIFSGLRSFPRNRNPRSSWPPAFAVADLFSECASNLLKPARTQSRPRCLLLTLREHGGTGRHTADAEQQRAADCPHLGQRAGPGATAGAEHSGGDVAPADIVRGHRAAGLCSAAGARPRAGAGQCRGAGGG